MRCNADVVVAGAGIIGCSIAFELAQRGRHIVVVDPNSGPGLGTTSYSSSVVRTFYSQEPATAASWESYHRWLRWRDYLKLPARECVPNFRHHDGMLLRTSRSQSFVEGFVRIAQPLGIPITELDIAETRRRCALAGWDVSKRYTAKPIDDPLFGVPEGDSDLFGSVAVPCTGYVSDPQLATANVMKAALATGRVRFAFRDSIAEVLKQGCRIAGVRLRHSSQKIGAPLLVNATGPHSQRFNQLVYDRECPSDSQISTRALRAEVAVLPAPPGIDLDRNGLIAPDFDLDIYMRPEFGNRLVVGSLDTEPASFVFEDDPGAQDCAFTHLWKQNVYRAALRMPQLQIPAGSAARGVVSLYDTTSDWTPVLDKSSVAGYYTAIGTSGSCFKTAPVIGEAIAKLIEYVEHGGDHDLYPLEMQLSHTRAILKLGHFSRLRHSYSTVSGVTG